MEKRCQLDITPKYQNNIHNWRAQEASILVGRKTVEIDNPSLTTREVEGENPVRIVFDPNLSLFNKYHIFNDEAKTLIFNYNKNENQNTNEFIKISKNNPINEFSLNFINLNSTL